MKALTLSALIAIAPVAAIADSLTLSAPMSGGTVHADTVDMSVYWLPSDTAFEVVAQYVDRNRETAPQRLRMRLEQGERVSFGLPGQTGTVYAFARSATALTVTAQPVWTVQAMN